MDKRKQKENAWIKQQSNQISINGNEHDTLPVLWVLIDFLMIDLYHERQCIRANSANLHKCWGVVLTQNKLFLALTSLYIFPILRFRKEFQDLCFFFRMRRETKERKEIELGKLLKVPRRFSVESWVLGGLTFFETPFIEYPHGSKR